MCILDEIRYKKNKTKSMEALTSEQSRAEQSRAKQNRTKQNIELKIKVRTNERIMALDTC